MVAQVIFMYESKQRYDNLQSKDGLKIMLEKFMSGIHHMINSKRSKFVKFDIITKR